MVKLALIVPLAALFASANAMADGTTPPQSRNVSVASLNQGEPEVRRLLELLDKDQNGKVSRAEVINFMNAELDRLDVNKTGELDLNETSRPRAGQKHPGGAGSR
jgi:hypothetical protein